ncbi:MAG: orotidine-5'-phosphate decarboxylase [Lentisphaeria bacterium]|jgi:orotidine-5'-phosphate decarboxylase
MPISSTIKSASLDPKIIIALDYDDRGQCIALVGQLDPIMCRLKVGKELFTRFGPAIVEELQGLGFDVFLDLKFHDIPNTVAKAVTVAAQLGVWMVNVHAGGGSRMMEAAKNALSHFQFAPKLIAVTVLTSMDENDLRGVGLQRSLREQVLLLARLAHSAGMDGVVCSALEASAIKTACTESFCCVTPGIRPLQSQADDQRRIMTPELALQSGSDYLVIGRPITNAENPLAALSDIHRTIV